MAVADVLSIRTKIPKGTWIIRETEMIDKLYIVKSGRCEVFKLLKLNGKTIQVKIGDLEIGTYFGESALEEKALPISPISVRCATEVELGELQIHDARAKLKKDITMTPFVDIEYEDILQKYREDQDFQMW
ncbi:hypothetical protein HK096_005434, partial [Nowakowskiella sp. JEL0078]